jgi:hypothetical protein
MQGTFKKLVLSQETLRSLNDPRSTDLFGVTQPNTTCPPPDTVPVRVCVGTFHTCPP